MHCLFIRNNLFPTLVVVLLMFSLFSCFKKKKTAAENIETWLDAHFPGRFEVLHSNINLNVMDIYRGHKTAIVADKSDTAIQFIAYWKKGQDELGLHEDAILDAWQQARSDTDQARQLFAALQTGGLERFSVAVIDESAFIQVFAEPDASARERIPTLVLSTLKKYPDQKQTRYWLEILEERAYRQKFGDIVPMGHWKTDKPWHDRELLFELDFEWSSDLDASQLRSGWQINTASERSGVFMDVAGKQAQIWADKNLKTPFYLEMNQMVAVEPVEGDGLAIRYSFPYFDEKPAEDSASIIEPKGYISGIYQAEERTFSKIKKVKPEEL